MHDDPVLDEQLSSSRSLWHAWSKYDVEHVPIKVDWDFYPPKSVDWHALEQDLRAEGFECERKQGRLLFIFKYTDFRVWTPARTWTEDEFLQATTDLYRLAEKHGAELGGCGAEMPDNE